MTEIPEKRERLKHIERSLQKLESSTIRTPTCRVNEMARGAYDYLESFLLVKLLRLAQCLKAAGEEDDDFSKRNIIPSVEGFAYTIEAFGMLRDQGHGREAELGLWGLAEILASGDLAAQFDVWDYSMNVGESEFKRSLALANVKRSIERRREKQQEWQGYVRSRMVEISKKNPTSQSAESVVENILNGWKCAGLKPVHRTVVDFIRRERKTHV